MIIKDNMANMCAKVTSTYMEFTLAFGPKPEFSFSFKLSENSYDLYDIVENTSSVWEHKKRAWYSRQASPTFPRVKVAGWVLLGCLGGNAEAYGAD